EVLLAELGSGGSRFLDGVLWKRAGQTEGADDRQRIDAGLAARPEDLRDDALAAVLRRGEAQHLDDDLVVGAGPLRTGVADVDAVREDGAVHTDQALAVALEIGADELARRAFEHLRDDAGRVAVAGPGFLADADEHRVAGGRVERRIGRDV